MNFDNYLQGIQQNISSARQILNNDLQSLHDELQLTERERAHRLIIVVGRLDAEIKKIEALLSILKRGGNVDVQIRVNDLLIKLKTLQATLTRVRLELNVEWL